MKSHIDIGIVAGHLGGIGLAEFRGRATKLVAVFICSHWVDVTPTIAIVPRVEYTSSIVRVALFAF